MFVVVIVWLKTTIAMCVSRWVHAPAGEMFGKRVLVIIVVMVIVVAVWHQELKTFT